MKYTRRCFFIFCSLFPLCSLVTKPLLRSTLNAVFCCFMICSFKKKIKKNGYTARLKYSLRNIWESGRQRNWVVYFQDKYQLYIIQIVFTISKTNRLTQYKFANISASVFRCQFFDWREFQWTSFYEGVLPTLLTVLLSLNRNLNATNWTFLAMSHQYK